MRKDGTGGANTQTGLRFERDSDLMDSLKKSGFVVRETAVYAYGEGVPVAISYPKGRLYSELLARRGVDYRDYLSAKLLPDEALFVPSVKRLHILEKKYQQTQGSVDEKLQTCDFKREQYSRLLKALGVEVTFSYVLNDWFRDARYRDVLSYIESRRCRYYFNEVPLADLDLPAPISRTDR